MLNITSGDMCWGYRNYLAHAVPHLAAHPAVDALLVGVSQTVDTSTWSGKAPSVQWLPLKCSLAARGREVSRNARKAIDHFSPDVLFIPTARYWPMDGVPVVNMVRNMMPSTDTYSTSYIDRIKNWARLAQMRSAVKGASRIIAVSEHVRSYLVDHLNVPIDKVGVVYHGAELSHSGSPRQPVDIPDDWRGKFVFAAGSIYPYRGLEDLVFAWDHLSQTSSRPYVAIAGFVGRGMKRYYARLKRLIKSSRLDSHIRFVGALSKAEMAWCYDNCLAFVMTSRIEACPNTALEAMRHGSLCLSTDSPPMPEIFGPAARYYPASDPAALAEHIRASVRLSDDERHEIKAVALTRASKFTWEACCEATVRELQKVLKRS